MARTPATAHHSDNAFSRGGECAHSSSMPAPSVCDRGNTNGTENIWAIPGPLYALTHLTSPRLTDAQHALAPAAHTAGAVSFALSTPHKKARPTEGINRMFVLMPLYGRLQPEKA